MGKKKKITLQTYVEQTYVLASTHCATGGGNEGDISAQSQQGELCHLSKMCTI